MADDTGMARKENDAVILTTPHNEYRFSYMELVRAEMQGSLGYVIASAFVGADRNAGKMTMKLYKEAIREILSA